MRFKKYIKNKYFIPSVLFIICIFFFGIMTLKSEYKKIADSFIVSKNTEAVSEGANITQQVLDIHSRFKDVVNLAYTDNLYKSNIFIDVYSTSQRLLGVKVLDDAGLGAIVVDNHDMLHFIEKRYDVTFCAQHLINLSNELNKNEIPLIYIQTPNKKLKNYTVFPLGFDNYANDNADDFLKILTRYNIDYIDLREKLVEDNLDLSTLFYKTDHHWTTPTAFWAFCKTVETLNFRYDMQIDPDVYYRNINNYTTTIYKNCFLGSQGRRVGSAIVGVDDYTLISPKFETDYTIYDANDSVVKPLASGKFEESIINQDKITPTDIATDRHAAYFGADFGHLSVINNNLNKGKRIVVVKDSFALPYCAFLSTCVSEVQMIDMRDFSKIALAQYIKDYKPDIVIFLYNPEVYSDKVMFNF